MDFTFGEQIKGRLMLHKKTIYIVVLDSIALTAFEAPFSLLFHEGQRKMQCTTMMLQHLEM